MISSKNILTLVLLVTVGSLGWLGGSHFSPREDTADPHSPPAAPAADKGHEGHNHAAAKDAHAGHDHGEPLKPGEICAEHRIPEAEDVLCNPQLMADLHPGEGVKLRLATSEAAGRAGAVIAPVKMTGAADGPAIPAQLVYNRSRQAEVTALAGGVVRRLTAEPGQRVSQGAVLAELASPGTALARADYQAALGRLELAEASVRREEELVAKGVSARMELEQARAERQAASAAAEQLRGQLTAFGAGTATGGGTALALRSPISGTVVSRNAVVGQTLAPETPLFSVVDLSSMWLELQGDPGQFPSLKTGAAVEAEFDGLPGQRFPGKIVQIATALNERTRLLRATAEIANPDGLLKEGMFGTAYLVAAPATAQKVEQHEPAHAGHDHAKENPLEELFADDAHGPATVVAVPAGAVQAIDGKSYVFVALEQDLFELRRVETGPRRAGEVLISTGLRDGEQVVASQGFALKSELLKSRLGASCADH